MLFTNIESLCKAQGISIAKLEQNSGLGNATIRNWRKASPTLDKLKRVADYFGVTVDELLADNPSPDQSRDSA